MRVELFPFQKRALADIRMKTAEAMGSYHRTHAPQVVSFTAPTGAGKTIIMSALIEAILFGDEQYMEQPDAIIVWLSDSPQLNEQSKQKIDSKADKIKLSQCVTVSEESFDTDNWINGFFGIGGFYLCCVANFDSARSEVVFARAERSENKAAFDALYQHKSEIESKLGTELQWNRGDDIKSSKVFIQLDNVSIENEDDWPQMAKFHAEWSKKFYDLIVPYITVDWQ